MKVLEDSRVMQLHCFIDEMNVLVTSNVLAEPQITKRAFEPEEYSNPRNIPDEYYGQVFNIGSSNSVSVQEIADLISGKILQIQQILWDYHL